MPYVPLFVVHNHHTESCGPPPAIDDRTSDDIAYRAYFENEYGEQWVLVYRQSTGAVVLYGGDCGWANELTVLPLKDVVGGLLPDRGDELLEHADALGIARKPIVCGSDGPVVLGAAEQQWLAACLTAIRNRWPGN